MNKVLQGVQTKKAHKRQGSSVRTSTSRCPSSNLKVPLCWQLGNYFKTKLKRPFQILICLATLTQDNKSAFAYKYSVSDISLIQMFHPPVNKNVQKMVNTPPSAFFKQVGQLGGNNKLVSMWIILRTGSNLAYLNTAE